MFKKKEKKEYIIPVFVPHLGCPQLCTFCDQRTISGEQNQVTASDVEATIEYYLKNFKDTDRYVEVAFFGGSFTAIPEEKQNELLEAVQPYIKAKKVNSIRCSTRPDAIDKKTLKRLKKYHMKVIELGVQSSNEYILSKCKRGHTFEEVKKASKLIRRAHIKLGHQIMLGLPEATEKDDYQTAKDSIKLKPAMVRIYPVLVIKGTELEREYNNGEYTPLTVGQAVERAKEIVNLYKENKVNVIRVGLQNSDTISEIGGKNSDVVAGPFHDAFGQLVEDSIWYDRILSEIKKINAKIVEVKIKVNRDDINSVIGHKRENIEKFKNTYSVMIYPEISQDIEKGKFKLEIIKTVN